jgi:hypothetical protein
MGWRGFPVKGIERLWFAKKSLNPPLRRQTAPDAVSGAGRVSTSARSVSCVD